MEENKELEVIEELRSENDELRNGFEELPVVTGSKGSSENEKPQNGSGDNGEHQPLKIKSKVSVV